MEDGRWTDFYDRLCQQASPLLCGKFTEFISFLNHPIQHCTYFLPRLIQFTKNGHIYIFAGQCVVQLCLHFHGLTQRFIHLVHKRSLVSSSCPTFSDQSAHCPRRSPDLVGQGVFFLGKIHRYQKNLLCFSKRQLICLNPSNFEDSHSQHLPSLSSILYLLSSSLKDLPQKRLSAANFPGISLSLPDQTSHPRSRCRGKNGRVTPAQIAAH